MKNPHLLFFMGYQRLYKWHLEHVCGHTLRVSLSCCRLTMCCCRELLVFCCCSCADLSCSCSRWHSAVTSHISISTHRHRRMQLIFQLLVFKTTKSGSRAGGFLLPWKFLAADGYPQALLSGRPAAPGGNFPASRHEHMTDVEQYGLNQHL